MKYRPPRFLFRRAALLRSIRPGESFLEVGAGDLALTGDLLEVFERGFAVEPNSDLDGFAASLTSEKQRRLRTADLPLEAISTDERFSCVVCCEVLEHIDDDRAFSERLLALVEPGGQVAISVPARMKWWSTHDEIVGHVRRYERDELSDLLADVGFANVRVLAYGYPWINLLRYPRLLLARLQFRERAQWDANTQTANSNHRQIPEALSTSPIRFLIQPWSIAPFAAVSRLFDGSERSDGYLAVATRP